MDVPWGGLLVLVLGVWYGYMTPGKQNKMALFARGILFGLLVAIVFALVGIVLNFRAFALGAGVIGIAYEAVVLTVLFVIGVFVGDLLEGKKKSAA
ncbi:MAG: hypothetical protein ACYDCK_03860 [Thermoplasmatota archaeon]